MIDSFLKPNGRRSLMFFYQEVEHDGSGKLITHRTSTCSGKLQSSLDLCIMAISP